MIRFVGLPFAFTSHGSRRTDAAKLGMIRFVEIALFSGIQKRFLLRKAADLIVEAHTIRFVRLRFVFANSAVRPIGARRQLTESK